MKVIIILTILLIAGKLTLTRHFSLTEDFIPFEVCLGHAKKRCSLNKDILHAIKLSRKCQKVICIRDILVQMYGCFLKTKQISIIKNDRACVQKICRGNLYIQ